MADWLLSPRQNAPRVFYAGTLLSVPLLVLLGAWFVSGWHDVQMRQHELVQAPRLVAERRASELSRELHAELEALIGREYSRPYFHYQNLMHDPKASPGLNVSPSPLAGGSEDKLVLGYFQVDANGLTTTPTINDDLPSLSAAERLADHRAFRDHVARDLSQSVKPKQSPTASAGSPPPTKLATSQKLTIDSNIYEQNAKPNTVYFQQAVNARPPALRKPSRPVTITVSPLEWRTLPFDRGPALVAIREVETPEGTFAQGFVVDRSALTSRLTSRAGGMVAELHADATGGAVVAPGWSLSVKPDPLALDQADAEARDVARGFLTRFVGIGSIAALAAAFVLVLVARSEKLARERSQFAAAAAHELRTPLSGLQLYGDMLADGLGDPAKARDYARRMSEEASRLGRVVSNVLGFSQLESGTLTVDAQVGPLGEALCELAERARPALDRAGVALELDVPSDLRARFDRDALARIVGNLLDNAEKYARGAADRTIRLAAMDAGKWVDVTVEDRGPGIADETKLFRAFSRGVTGGSGPEGLGLGLALSMSVARAMGGDLLYQPRNGGGARFVLHLPHMPVGSCTSQLHSVGRTQLGDP